MRARPKLVDIAGQWQIKVALAKGSRLAGDNNGDGGLNGGVRRVREHVCCVAPRRAPPKTSDLGCSLYPQNDGLSAQSTAAAGACDPTANHNPEPKAALVALHGAEQLSACQSSGQRAAATVARM